MAKRLDGSTTTPFYRKWWVAASLGTVLVGSALYFGLKNNETSTEKNTETSQQTTAPSTTNENNLLVDQKSAKNTATPNELNTNEQVQSTTSTNSALKTEIVHNSVRNTTIEGTINPGVKNDPVNNSNPIANTTTPNTSTNTTSEISPVLLAKTVLCIGEEMEITNPNSQATISVIQNGRTQLVKANGTRIITANTEGKIEVISGKHTQSISVVKPQSKLYISVDPTLIYENGIPSIEFDVTGNENNVKWQVEKHPYEIKGGNLVVHPYQGQEIKVTAISKDQNGCVVEETKTVRIEERYNLQAATGFRPTSGDSRTNRFMPYALIERNVAFDMHIYDSKSGIVIFKTSDAMNGWDGKNMNTGELMKVGSTYAWKVTLHKPNPGEPVEYKGTITITE